VTQRSVAQVKKQEAANVRVRVYPVVRAYNIRELMECQRPVLQKIGRLRDAQTATFSKTKCPTVCSLHTEGCVLD